MRVPALMLVVACHAAAAAALTLEMPGLGVASAGDRLLAEVEAATAEHMGARPEGRQRRLAFFPLLKMTELKVTAAVNMHFAKSQLTASFERPFSIGTSKEDTYDLNNQDALVVAWLPTDALVTELSMTIHDVTYVGRVEPLAVARAAFQAARTTGKAGGQVEASTAVVAGMRAVVIKVTVPAVTDEGTASKSGPVFKLAWEHMLHRANDKFTFPLLLQPPNECDLSVDVEVYEPSGLRTIATSTTGATASKTSAWAGVSAYTAAKDSLRAVSLTGSTALRVPYSLTWDEEPLPAGGLIVRGTGGTFTHLWNPNGDGSMSAIPKSVVFVVQTSKVDSFWRSATKKAMATLLESLPATDDFGIVTAGSGGANALVTLRAASSSNTAAAKSALLAAVGTSQDNAEPPVKDAVLAGLSMLSSGGADPLAVRPRVLIFITSGTVSGGAAGRRAMLSAVAAANPFDASAGAAGDPSARTLLFTIETFEPDVSASTSAARGDFLTRLARANGGSSRRLVPAPVGAAGQDAAAAVTADELHAFYKSVASVVLRDVKMTYDPAPTAESETTSSFPGLSPGAELAVSGRLASFPSLKGGAEVHTSGTVAKPFGSSVILAARITARSRPAGNAATNASLADVAVTYNASAAPPTPADLAGAAKHTERLWAYLRVSQIMADIATLNDGDPPASVVQTISDKAAAALKIALAYSLVVPGLTSMVVDTLPAKDRQNYKCIDNGDCDEPTGPTVEKGNSGPKSTMGSGDGGAVCFPGASTVLRRAPGGVVEEVAIREVRTGDEVMVATGGDRSALSFEPVLFFLHFEPRTSGPAATQTFVTITAGGLVPSAAAHGGDNATAGAAGAAGATLSRVLTLTPDHYVFVAGAGAGTGGTAPEARQAKDVRVGDVLLVVPDAGGAVPATAVLLRVSRVDSGVKVTDMYSIATASGTNVVDGVVASNYASVGTWLLSHERAHFAMLPWRLPALLRGPSPPEAEAKREPHMFAPRWFLDGLASAARRWLPMPSNTPEGHGVLPDECGAAAGASARPACPAVQMAAAASISVGTSSGASQWGA